MTASQKVEVERQIKQNDGSVQIVMTPPNKVLPGDMLVYTLKRAIVCKLICHLAIHA